MGFTGNPVGVAQDLQLQISLNQTAADRQKQDVRHHLSHSDHYTASLSLHSTMNAKPDSNSYNSHIELKEYTICIVMAKIETFLKFIFLIYTANAVTDRVQNKCLADGPPSFPGTLYINETCLYLKFQCETFSSSTVTELLKMFHSKM